MSVIDIGSRLELFVDGMLVDELRGTRLKLHEPQKQPLARHPIDGGYMTVIKDGPVYRAFYRQTLETYTGEGEDGNPGETYRYAESADGIDWTCPELGLYDIGDGGRNNIVLYGDTPCTHNLSPFLDARPGVPASERFKALAGVYWSGLYAFGSPDGIRWTLLTDQPVMATDFTRDKSAIMFDSQNVSFWSETEGCYVCYFRTLKTPHGRLRSVSRATSADYRTWGDRIDLEPNDPGEHLYTSQTHPYFRAPHLYLALPTRFAPDRGDSTEILFMATRGDQPYTRLFKEAFIRPGLDPARWGNRANYAALNVVPTGPEELSLYHAGSGDRYTLRTDGFVSINAPHAGGEMITKVFVFSGEKLVLNLSTAATGSARVALLDAGGAPLPGFGLDDCRPIVGDAIEQAVAWNNGTDVSSLAGKPVRLKVALQDSDLYAIQFRER